MNKNANSVNINAWQTEHVGVQIAAYAYDCLGRRVKKTTSTATTHFFYDGWNLVREIEVRGAETNVVEYVWGKDLSGSFQGAGGVGGLLYEKRNGAIYIPYQDAFGNIMGYWDTNGVIVAEYTYDAFGKIISQSGTMADVFRHRFSTKYYDSETGFYYYGYRCYFPELRRWFSRDPLEEEGGENLFRFVFNNSITFCDSDGRLIFPILSIRWNDHLPEPTIFDHFGNSNEPFHEERWFDTNYSGWINTARSLFIREINDNVDCKESQVNKRSSRQSITPGMPRWVPWTMPNGGNDRRYGDRGQNNWLAVAVLGDFAIDYVTPIVVQYSPCVNGTRSYSWSTTMYVEDVLGLQGNESWLGRYFGWAAKSRRVRRAQWIINGHGTCRCCR